MPAMELLFVLFMAAVIFHRDLRRLGGSLPPHPSDLCVDSRAVARRMNRPPESTSLH